MADIFEAANTAVFARSETDASSLVDLDDANDRQQLSDNDDFRYETDEMSNRMFHDTTPAFSRGTAGRLDEPPLQHTMSSLLDETTNDSLVCEK